MFEQPLRLKKQQMNIQKTIQKFKLNNQIRKVNDQLLKELYNTTTIPQTPGAKYPQAKIGRDTEYATILRSRISDLQKEKSHL